MSGILCSMVGATFAVAAEAEVIRAKKGITAVGNAQVDTAQSKFGGASALFDGAEDWLQCDNNPIPSSGDFTVEFWFRPSAIGTLRPIWSNRDSGGTHRGTLYINATGGITWWNASDNLNYTSNLSVNTWYHIACVKHGSIRRLFINGDGVSASSGFTPGTILEIGAAKYSSTVFGDEVIGHIDEFRVSNTARYTANFTAPTTAFVNDENTLLLLHMDGTDASTVFEDDNGVRAKKGITAIGNAQVDTAQSKFGGASALFDGTGDYLLIDSTNSSSLNFGTGNFTIEFWARNTNRDAFHTVIANNKSSWTAGSVTILGGSGSTSTTALRLAANSFNSGGAGIVHDNQAMTLGVWYHYAIVRSGNSFTMYRDGTSVSTGTFSGSINLGDEGTRIGYTRWDGDVSTWDGHIDEVRVSNSVRYTSNFTAPTTPFVNDANTLLLIHADGTDASTYFEDDNGQTPPRIPKHISYFGNAQIDTAQSKFGGASALFDGSGDRLIAHSIPDLTSNLTIEFWYRHNTFGGQAHFIDARLASDGSVNKPTLYRTTSNTLELFFANSSVISGAWTPTSGVWYHIALVRNSGVVRIYVDGTQLGSNWSNSQTWTTSNYSIGDYISGGFGINGHLDELRISNTARYTANFTPSTTAFQNDANTVLLIHADGTDASTTFVDDAGQRSKKGVTAIGNAQVDTAQYKFGGSSYLGDGTGDYLLSTANSDYDFGTSSFTIEYWIRFNVAPTLYVPIALRPSASILNGQWWCEITNAEKKMYWGFKNQAGTQYYVNLALAGTAFTTGQWYHIALVNNAGTAQMYVDGVATGSTTALSGSFGNSTSDLWVGAGAGAYSLNGWLDEIRISNTARYTANFTPSTSPFQNDDNTLLLLHMDGTDASTVFTDDNGVPPDYDYGA